MTSSPQAWPGRPEGTKLEFPLPGGTREVRGGKIGRGALRAPPSRRPDKAAAAAHARAGSSAPPSRCVYWGRPRLKAPSSPAAACAASLSPSAAARW